MSKYLLEVSEVCYMIYYRTGAHVRVCLAFFREVGWSEEGRDESRWDEVGERERENRITEGLVDHGEGFSFYCTKWGITGGF